MWYRWWSTSYGVWDNGTQAMSATLFISGDPIPMWYRWWSTSHGVWGNGTQTMAATLSVSGDHILMWYRWWSKSHGVWDNGTQAMSATLSQGITSPCDTDDEVKVMVCGTMVHRPCLLLCLRGSHPHVIQMMKYTSWCVGQWYTGHVCYYVSGDHIPMWYRWWSKSHGVWDNGTQTMAATLSVSGDHILMW